MNKDQYHLLVVDDNAFNSEILSRRLSGQGYKVTIAENGIIALGMMEVHDFDLVLLDVLMPKVDGYEALKRIKENASWRHIPVIMITAVDNVESAARCIEMGAEDYITKPFNSVFLLARVGACLERKRLHDQLATAQPPLDADNGVSKPAMRSGAYSAIFTLAKLVESRDPFRIGHLERVQVYCTLLCRQLRTDPTYTTEIDDRFMEQIRAASPLHDIGQIRIPDAVLRKPGKLETEEQTLFQTHSKIGADTLRQIEVCADTDYIPMAIEIAESHHERWDGSGYPHGLRGEDTPLSARIVALADVYDALTTKRSYRDPLSHAKSHKLIQDEGGKQFDPDIVDAFLASVQEFQAFHARLPDTPTTKPMTV